MTEKLLWDQKKGKQDIPGNTINPQEWNTRIIKVDKDYDYVPVIMAKVFRRRMEDVFHIDRHVSLSENDPERIASTIAHTAPVSAKELF